MPDQNDDNEEVSSHEPLHQDTNTKEDGDDDDDGRSAGTGEENEEEEESLNDQGDEEDEEEEEDLSSTAPPKKPKDPRSRKRRRRDRMFQDCVSIQIPLDITADLGVAIRRTRRKRIEALTKSFPELVAEKKTDTAEANVKENPIDSIKGDTTMDVDEDEEGKNKTELNSPPRKNLSHVPRREDYANVVDYLEAKYVQGVMLNDDEEGEPGENGEKDDEDEGQGSVYSQSSFLDDQDLQRGVAEQVLAQSTTTKLELESNIDDAFFVNVGTLEVEESFMTEEGYDPLQYVETAKKPQKKKRKPADPKDKKETKSTATAEKDKEKKKPASKTPASKEKKDNKASAASKKKAGAAESPKKKSKAAAKGAAAKKKEKAPATAAEKAAAAKKKEVDVAYKNVVNLIKAMSPEDLPRRKTKEKVAITCPADKKPGDSILFANPHVPGQRLKVKIPKKTAPGGTFRVSVPVAPNPEDEDDNVDHNKWSRDFYDCFGDYCTLYDDWIDLVAVVKEEAGVQNFLTYFEKRNRFDQMVQDKNVPQDLKTPLDKAYMQKLLRRARQNRHKRERTLKRQEERAKELRAENSDDPDDQDGSKSAAPGDQQEKKVTEEGKEEADHTENASTRTVFVPQLATEFPPLKFNPSHFDASDRTSLPWTAVAGESGK